MVCRAGQNWLRLITFLPTLQCWPSCCFSPRLSSSSSPPSAWLCSRQSPCPPIIELCKSWWLFMLCLIFYHLRAESLPSLHSVMHTGGLPLLTHQDVENLAWWKVKLSTKFSVRLLLPFVSFITAVITAPWEDFLDSLPCPPLAPLAINLKREI